MGKISVKTLRRLAMKRLVSANTYWSMKKILKRKNHRVSYTRAPFEVDVFTNSECRLYFRFSLPEIEMLLQSLKIPKVNWLENRIKFSGKEGLCILLRRLSYPNRLSELVPMFKRDEGTISRIFNFMLEWMYNHHAKRLHSLKLNYLTGDVLKELADNSLEKGCPYPNVVGYIDGTCRPICRPTYDQREMYSGYKKQHVTKYQSIVLTNGLIGCLDGPFIGRRHDAAIVHLSNIIVQMKTHFTNADGSYWAVYGDPGYSNQKYIKVGVKNTLNKKEKEFNTLMSSLRVGVEYGFGLIVQQFAFIDFKKTQKQYLAHLKEMYFVAAFLVNCQTCIRGGNQISNIFDSYTVTLEEYLS